jgi:hypothetical protein
LRAFLWKSLSLPFPRPDSGRIAARADEDE